MLKYFRGCWKLFREIRSIEDKHYIGIVNEGIASFQPWSFHVNSGDSSTDISSTSTNTSSKLTDTTNLKQTYEQWLLYRESGKFENFDFPAASGQFTRQYLYKFPEINTEKQNHIQVFHCSKTTLKFTDLDPLNNQFDATAFNQGDYFHDLLFPKSVNWESLIPMKVADTLAIKEDKEPVTSKTGKESMTSKTDKESVTVAMSKEPLTAAGQHLCGRDVYKGQFQIYSADNFQTVWKVTGPEKSFQIVSIYTRFS